MAMPDGMHACMHACMHEGGVISTCEEACKCEEKGACMLTRLACEECACEEGHV